MAGLLDQLGILAHWNKTQPAERLPYLYGMTEGGAAHVNPMMMAQGYRAAQSRLAALLASGYPLGLSGLLRDDAMPARNIMQVPAQPMGNLGIHAWPFPGASLPNQYRGLLSPQGQPGVPDAPEHYVPGFANQFLRRI